MRKLPNIYLRLRLGEAALNLNVDITQIHREAKGSAKQKRLIAIDSQRFLPGPVKRMLKRSVWELSSPILDAADITPVPIEETTAYRRMADVWTHRECLIQSETYETIRQAISDTGRFRHKRYEIKEPDDILDMIRACYLDILISMAADGYRSDRSNSFATAGTGGLIIWQSGELISGPAATHRKAAARILGMTTAFPLRVVGLNRKWLIDSGLTDRRSLDRLPAALLRLPGILSTSPGQV